MRGIMSNSSISIATIGDFENRHFKLPIGLCLLFELNKSQNNSDKEVDRFY
jgi:hypothetical protein